MTTTDTATHAPRRVLLAAVAAVAALLLAGALAPVPAGAQAAVGGPLDQPPATAAGCEQYWLLGSPPSTCTVFSALLQAPRGSGVLTSASVRTGPRTGPMRFVVVRAMRSQAVPPGQNPTGVICCSSPIQSQVFTPPPNQVTTVPVSLPMLNTVTDIDGEPVEIVDYLGISFGLDTSLPLAASSSQIPTNSVYMPAIPQTQEFVPPFAPSGGTLTINGTVCPSTAAGGWDLAAGRTGAAAAACSQPPPTPGPTPPGPTPPGPDGAGVARLAGDDRAATAARISAATFDPGVPVAFVATGAGFPDALSAGPLAARAGGPILLSGSTSLPAATEAELARLRPDRIVVLGGAGAVSEGVARALRGLTPGGVTRLEGPDRYATAARIADEFPAGQPVVFVATGRSFPDALAGAAAAGAEDAPLLLVGADEVPAATRTALARLAPERIVVLGGEGVVSAGVERALGGLAGAVERIAGSDRFATAAAVATRFGSSVDTVVVATGRNFPDALAGTPAAVQRGAPVLLVEPGSLPSVVEQRLRALAPRQVVVLGGRGAVDDAVVADLERLVGAG